MNDNLGLPFDLFTRNYLIANLVNKLREKTPLKILDVGGRGGYLNNFFEKDLYNILGKLSPETRDSSSYVQGNYTQLPFKDNSFDIVISSDMYEHISPECRKEAVTEMLRVSKNFMVLAAPFYSDEVEIAKINANEFSLRCTKKQHPWLKEHIDNILPSCSELETFLRDTGYEFIKIGTNNIYSWLQLQLLIYYAHWFETPSDNVEDVNRFYNENFLELGDLLEPTYRKIYLIGEKSTIPEMDPIPEHKGIDPSKQQWLSVLVFDAIRGSAELRDHRTLDVRSVIRDLECKNAQLANQLKIATSQANALEVEMKRSVIWRVMMMYQHEFVDRVMPQGTKSRELYDMGIKGCRILLKDGPAALCSKYRDYRGQKNWELNYYERWYSKTEPSIDDLKGQRALAKKFGYRPLISIVTPIYNTPPAILEATIKSVIDQTYDNWEMCLVDGNSEEKKIREIIDKYARSDSRIKIKYLDRNLGISGNSNEALKLVNGEFVALLDHDDLLAPFALYEVVQALNKNRKLDFIYSDRDLITEDGSRRFQPLFKPDWSPDIMLSANYLTHVCVIRKGLVDEVGGFSSETDGAQDWDIFLKITERTREIYHIPKILYHWRTLDTSCSIMGAQAKPYIFDAQCRAIEGHLQRIGMKGRMIIYETGFWRVKWQIGEESKVSIIIPTKDNTQMLRNCVNSILFKSSYKNFELIIIDTGSRKDTSKRYYEDISNNKKIKIISYEGPFNYSRVNNMGAKHATGDVLLFLNDDTEAISTDWIEELIGWAEQEQIGVVGAKLLRADNTIQHAGIVIGMQGFAGHPFSGAREGYMGVFGSSEWYRDYLAVTGACMMIRRTVFEDVKGFDEEFELNGSDVELCLRIRKKGYRVVYTPFAKLMHHEGASRKKYIKHIPKNDFKVSYKYYKQFMEEGDPYYNINLSKWSTIPCIRQKDEKIVEEVLNNGVD